MVSETFTVYRSLFGQLSILCVFNMLIESVLHCYNKNVAHGLLYILIIMKMIQCLFASVAIFGFFAGSAHAVSYTFVGSWNVGDGEYWRSNPVVYTGQEAAAFLFGGSPSDYAISTVSDQVADINFRTWLDGLRDMHTYGPGSAGAPQDFKVDDGAPGYYNPIEGPAYSAFVRDHFYNYFSGEDQATAINYAFRVNDDPQSVPDGGATLSLLGCALVGLTLLKRSLLTNAAVPSAQRDQSGGRH